MVPPLVAPCMADSGVVKGGTQGGHRWHHGPHRDCSAPGAGRGPAHRSGAGGTSVVPATHLAPANSSAVPSTDDNSMGAPGQDPSSPPTVGPWDPSPVRSPCRASTHTQGARTRKETRVSHHGSTPNAATRPYRAVPLGSAAWGQGGRAAARAVVPHGWWWLRTSCSLLMPLRQGWSRLTVWCLGCGLRRAQCAESAPRAPSEVRGVATKKSPEGSRAARASTTTTQP